jgi:predicted TIM-barrel fold metal-dependent hydrolase
MQPVERAIAEMAALPIRDGVREKWMYGNAAGLMGLA